MRTIRIRVVIDMRIGRTIRGVVVRAGTLAVAGLVPVAAVDLVILILVVVGRVMGGRAQVAVLAIPVQALEPAPERRLRTKRGVV